MEEYCGECCNIKSDGKRSVGSRTSYVPDVVLQFGVHCGAVLLHEEDHAVITQ